MPAKIFLQRGNTANRYAAYPYQVHCKNAVYAYNVEHPLFMETGFYLRNKDLS
jgi:hypothetical protein